MSRGILALLALLAAVPGSADQTQGGEEEPPEVLVEDPIGVPLRVRDFTFPSFLVLDFAPQPAAPLGQGRFGVELITSRVNDFQVSATVQDYLRERGGGVRRPLTDADADFIVSLPEGQGYYIDGEFSFYELGFWYGVTDRIDAGVGVRYIDFTGGRLDGTIFDFHDRFGFGQQGRELVSDDYFQIVIGESGTTLARLNGPPTGGPTDPSLYLRWALPGEPGGWRFNLGGGVKVPAASGFRSSGSADVGLNFAADRRWRRNALILNVSVVDAGRFEITDFDPAAIKSLDVAWLHRSTIWPNTRFFLQALLAEHVLGDATASRLSEPEFQVTAGLKWDTGLGVFGFGLTENLLNYQNTPDIGVHLSWGYLSGGEAAR
ncbi:MAG: DUF3187 family protein [Thermoanaerobaculia bacterium]